MAEKTDISLDLLVDGEKERLAVGLNDDERGTLERYVDFCGFLEDTIFVSGGIKPISVDMNETGDFNLSVTAPDRKEVSHALHELRPLVLQTEPTQFGRVRNIISERISHQHLRDYLRFLRRYYEFRPRDTDPTPPQAGFTFGVEFNSATEEACRSI